jgi:hypothetical protein
MSVHDRETEAIYRATQRVAQRRAKLMLRELRVAVREKAKARRVSRQRLLSLGNAVVAGGCGEWQQDEVTGALLDVLDRIGNSPTMRLGFRKKAQVRSQRVTGEVGPISRGPTDQGGSASWEDPFADSSI